MSQYYLMAQLPSLDGISEASPLPITQERFNELCEQFLSKKKLSAFRKLTLVPSKNAEPSGSKLIDAWNDGERKLRLALGSIRANKMKKTFETENDSIPAQLLQTARTAAEANDPLEAEMFLNSYRLGFLEDLRPADAFSDDAVYYYGLKLGLISRMRLFDEAKGREEYRNIYSSIISGDRQEAE